MPDNNAPSIADRSRPAPGARVFWGVFIAALIAGALGAWHTAAAGLTLSHYDARAHLVVARRVMDSLTPGWRQFGAVWLPLPHLLNLVPSQWDWAYRTGAIGVAISIAALGYGLAAVARRLLARTGSLVAGLTPAALILANPNVLYLQSTPMTEPLLFGLSLACLAALDDWIERPHSATRRRAGWLLAALIMTRYEGWLIGAGLVAVASLTTWRRGLPELARLVAPATAALAAFLVLSYASTGQWWLSTDFFVPEGEARHQPLKAAGLIVTGLRQLSSLPVLAAAALGALACLARARRGVSALLPIALLFSGVLPLVAFSEGHPFRIRYMVPLVIACAVLAAEAIARLPRRLQVTAAAALVAAAVWIHPPTDSSAPMVVEAQWETPFRLERQHVTDALRQVYDGTPILASMGSLAHYMHETSAIGLPLRSFLHEGNGDLWAEAIRSPRLSVRWVLIEARAEGGDVLAARARTDPEFLSGFKSSGGRRWVGAVSDGLSEVPGFRVPGFRFRGSGVRVRGSGFEVLGSRFWVRGSGCSTVGS